MKRHCFCFGVLFESQVLAVGQGYFPGGDYPSKSLKNDKRRSGGGIKIFVQLYVFFFQMSIKTAKN